MKKAISVGVVLTVAALAMALAGATSAAGPGVARSATPNTVSGHVRAAGAAVVKQIGARNYAGPNCPGAGWNCTTSTRVFQASSPGGQNVAECSGAGAVLTGTSCEITQTGASNVAKCTFKSSEPSATQSCKIRQSGASNMATIAEYLSSTTLATQEGTQEGTQTAEVVQGPASGGTTAFNVARVTQSISQSAKTGETQQQDAHQKTLVTQTAAGAGYNQSDINQSQLQKAYGGSTQNQDSQVNASANCFDEPPAAPNACSNVVQQSASGTNQSTLNQSIDQDANTSAAPATQRQGSSSGGLEGRVHQETTSGSSQNKAKQSKNQKLLAPSGSTQIQYDPVYCCGSFSQLGGSRNVEDINQSSAISASIPTAEQHSLLVGVSRTPNGTCTVNQKAAINGASGSNSESLTPCPFLTLTTFCTGGGVEARGDSCSAPEPEPDSSLALGVRNFTDGETTYGTSRTAATGETVEYQAVYTNSGDIAAHDVMVTIPVPAGTTYVSSTCPQSSSVNFVGGVAVSLNCTLGPTASPGTVAPGESAIFRTVTMQVTVSATSGSITNTASVDTAEEDPVSSNSTTVSVVNAAPASSLSKGVREFCFEGTCPNYASTATVNNGGQVEYRILYANAGLGDAHNVTVTDVLDALHVYDSSSCSGSCSYDSNTRTITWSLGTVAPTGQNPVALTFTAHLGGTGCGSTLHAVNSGSATSTEEQSPVQSGSTDVSILTSPC